MLCEGDMMLYILLSFLTGIIIVVSMMLNGRLAQREGMINGVIINYASAFMSSLLLCAVMLKTMPSYSNLRMIPLSYFLGGFLGVLTTYLFNIIVPRVPAVYVVILRFVGQMFASALIDYIYLDIFSRGKVIGGALFLIGLSINARVDSRNRQKQLKACEGV